MFTSELALPQEISLIRKNPLSARTQRAYIWSCQNVCLEVIFLFGSSLYYLHYFVLLSLFQTKGSCILNLLSHHSAQCWNDIYLFFFSLEVFAFTLDIQNVSVPICRIFRITVHTFILVSGSLCLWLRRCATSRKVPGSIPGRVTVDFFPKHPAIPCARSRLSL